MLSARHFLRICMYFGLSIAVPCSIAFAQSESQPNITGQGTLNPNGQQPVNFSSQTRGTSTSTTGPITLPDNFSHVLIAPGFLLNIQVFGEPDYTGQLRVSEAGNVNVPTVGSVHVAGDTLAQAETAIAEQFKQAQVLRDPQVTLDVAEYTGGKVAVLGEVEKPGTMPLLAPESLQTVLGEAGGVTSLAGNRITITPGATSGDGKTPAAQTITYSRQDPGDTLADVMVHPGDTVRVDRAGIIYVLGAVAKPGGYVMQEDGHLDVMQALALANGTNLDAATGSIRVVRREDGRTISYHVPFEALTKGKRQPMTLQPEDIVYVPVNKLKAVLTQSIVSSLPAAAIYAH